MATEVAFARQFLAALETRPIKISSDHVADPTTYPAQPAPTLPRISIPPPAKRIRPSPSAQQASQQNQQPNAPTELTILLRPLRPPPGISDLTLTLPPTSTSLYDIKTRYASAFSLQPSKLKLLHRKRPAGSDTKLLAELLTNEPEGERAEGEPVEINIMLLPGAQQQAQQEPAPPSPGPSVPTPDTAVGVSPADHEPTGTADAAGLEAEAKEHDAAHQAHPAGVAALRTEAFWDDLRGFLVQRVRDEAVAEDLVGRWRGGWE